MNTLTKHLSKKTQQNIIALYEEQRCAFVKKRGSPPFNMFPRYIYKMCMIFMLAALALNGLIMQSADAKEFGVVEDLYVGRNATTPYGGIGRYQNMLKYSEDFEQSDWVPANVTPSNGQTGPDGTTNADLFTNTAVNGNVSQTVTAAVSTQYTLSVWLASGTAATAQLELVGNGTGDTATTEACTLTTSWQRFSVSHTTVADATQIIAAIKNTGANTATIKVWGAQLEQAGYARVYVKTTTTAVSEGYGLVSNNAIALPNLTLTGGAISDSLDTNVDISDDLTLSGVLKVNGAGGSYFIGNIGIGTTAPTALLAVGNNAFTINSSGQVSAGTWQGTAVGDTYVADTLTISGGTINNTSIGGTVSAGGTFTNLTASGTVSLPNNSVTDAMVSNTLTASDLVAGSAVVADSEVVDALTISGGTINNTIIGGTVAQAGTFTNLTASGTVSLPADSVTDAMVVNTLTASNYVPLAGGVNVTGALNIGTTSGNVGIGTAVPGNYKLNVNGPVNVSGNLDVTGTVTAAGLAGATSTSGTSNQYFAIDADFSDVNPELRFQTGSGAYKSIAYDETNTEFDFNDDINVTGGVTASNGLTVSAGTVSLPADSITDTMISNTLTASDLAAGSAVVADSEVVDALTISGGTINATSIGATAASTGAFTTLSSTQGTTLATASGNVGIGTTAPNEKLEVSGGNLKVSGTGDFDGANLNVGTRFYVSNANSVATTRTDYLLVDSNIYDDDDIVNINDNLGVDGTGDSYIKGNVGIGTMTPTSKVHGLTIMSTATGNETAYQLAYTTNKATSGNDTGLLIAMTDTLSPGTSRLLDLQVAGGTKFNVDNAGNTDIQGNLIVSGDLTIQGTQTILNTQTVEIESNELKLNRNVTGAPSLDASIVVERGTSTDTYIKWDEANDKWVMSNGTSVLDIANPYTAGDGLTLTGQDFDVNVDASTIEISGDTLQVKDSGITSAKIAADTIVAGDIATGAVETTEILDGTIANVDINASAGIAGTKIAPDFGSQVVVTTGNVGIGTVVTSSHKLNVLGNTNITGNLEVSGTVTAAGLAGATSTSGTNNDTFAIDADYNGTNPGLRFQTGAGTYETITYDETNTEFDFSQDINAGANALMTTGNLSDGTNTLTVANAKTAYDHSQTSSGSVHGLTLANVSQLGSTIESSEITDGTITSTDINDGTIMNADVNASAAIAGTKIAPDFGSQNIVTTGNATVSGDVTVDTDTFKIDAVRNMVGIGTISPEAKLDVAGTLRVSTSGDSGAGNDFILTNIDGSTIKSFGPLTVQSGGSNDNYNLVLKGTGTGKVYVEDDLQITGDLTLPALSIPSSGAITFGSDASIQRSAADTIATASGDNFTVNGNLTVTGNSSIGTVTSGTWQGTAVGDTYVADALTISGGTINNTVIGGTVASAGTFTNLTASGTLSLPADSVTDAMVSNTLTASDLAAGSAVVADSEVVDALTISGGTINNTIIGGTVASAGTFTDLTATGTVSLPADSITDAMVVNTVTASNYVPLAGGVNVTGALNIGTTSGNVGIGTAAPGSYKLNVNGPMYTAGAFTTMGNITGGSTLIDIDKAYTASSGGSNTYNDHTITRALTADVGGGNTWTVDGAVVAINNTNTQTSGTLVDNSTLLKLKAGANAGANAYFIDAQNSSGTSQFKIDTSGNGTFAGTVNISGDLNVTGNQVISGETLYETSQTVRVDSSSAFLVEKTGTSGSGADVLIVDTLGASGMVGINKTPASGVELDVSGDGDFSGSLKAGTNDAFQVSSDGVITLGGDTTFYRSAQDILKTDDTINISGDLQVTGSGPHYISSGNVGVGTTAPLALFSVGNNAFKVASNGTISAGTWQGTAVGDTYVSDTLTISGGTINNTAIGGTVASAGTFTNLTASGTVSLPADSITDAMVSNTLTASDLVAGSAVVADSEVVDALTISGGTINASSIGGTVASTGAFTTLSSTQGATLATASGNIGISQTSPTYKLDITGDMRNTTGAYFATSSGNVGVGTIVPTSKVHGLTTMGTATGNETAYQLAYTTNKATSGNDTGLLIAMTDTLSPGTSRLLDLQVGGGTKFNVDNAGNTDIQGNLVVAGDLTIQGTQTILNTQTVEIESNELKLNRNVTGAPSLDASIVVERGTSTDTYIKWDEANDKWVMSNGTSVLDIANPYTAGDGLTLTGQDFDVNVDASTIEINADTLRVKDAGITSAKIAADTIIAGDIATGAVETTEILDGTIANVDVNASAAIAGTKISPDFGTQVLVTTGNVGIGTVVTSSYKLNVLGNTNITGNLEVSGTVTATGLAGATSTSGTNNDTFSIDANYDGTNPGLRFQTGAGTYKSIIYDETNTEFDFDDDINVTGGVTASNGLTISAGTVSLPADSVTDTMVSNTLTASDLSAGSSVIADAEVDNNLTISGGTINNTSVGATVASTGAFTTLSSTQGTNLATASGNVGIGTTSTNAKLEISGMQNPSIRLQSNHASGANYRVNIGTNYDTEALTISVGATPYKILSTEGYDTPEITHLWSNNAKTLTLNSGNVGIGTVAPTALFAVGNNAFKVESNGIVSAGTWQGTAIGDTYVSDALTISAGTINNTIIGGTVSAGGTFTNLTASGTVSLPADSITDAMVVNTLTASNYVPLAGGVNITGALNIGTTSGNVGIGTIAPTSSLDVSSGSITLENDEMIQNTTNGNVLLQGQGGTADLSLDIDLDGNYVTLNGTGSMIGFFDDIGLRGTELIVWDTSGGARYTTIDHVQDAYTSITNSAGDMYLGPVGNVGIGTTAPGNYKLNVNGPVNISGALDVTGTVTAAGLAGATSTSGTSNQYFAIDSDFSDVNPELRFQTGSGAYKSIAYDETNTEFDFNDDINLSTNALITTGNLSDGTNTLTVANAKTAYDHSQNTTSVHNLTIANVSQLGSSIESSEITNDTIVNADINTSAAIAGTKISPDFGSQNIITTGNVGIGTTAPVEKLQIVGGHVLIDNTKYLKFKRSDGTAVSTFGITASDALNVYTPNTTASSGVRFMNPASTDLMFIGSTGNIGIGTIAPASKLHGLTAMSTATGNETAYQLAYTTNKATSGNDTGLLIAMTDTLSPGTSRLLDLQVGGGTRFNVDNAGNTDIQGNLVVQGDLTIQGTQTILNTQTVEIESNELKLNRNVTGAPSLDASIIVERGASEDTYIKWDEANDKWVMSNGTSVLDIANPYTAGDGLTLTGQDFDVNVDNSTIEISGDTLQVKDSGITSAKIAGDTIVAGDIATGAVETTEILDGTIANVDINASASIAGTKIAPDFGTQVVVTTGNVGIGTVVTSSYKLNVLGNTNITGNLEVSGTVTAAGLAGATSTSGTSNDTFTIDTNYDGTNPALRFQTGAGTYKSIIYDETNTEFDFDDDINVTGGVTVSNGLTISAGTVSLPADTITDTMVSNTLTASDLVASSAVVADSEVVDVLTISGGTINATSVGATVASTGAFTTLSSTQGTTLATATGNVGIGTTAPLAKLQIDDAAGEVLRLKDIINVDTYMSFSNTGVVTLRRQNGSNANLTIGTTNAGTFGATGGSIILSPVSEAMRILTTGNVGIGTTAPSAKLEISGIETNSASTVKITNTTATTGKSWKIISKNDGTADIVASGAPDKVIATMGVK